MIRGALLVLWTLSTAALLVAADKLADRHQQNYVEKKANLDFPQSNQAAQFAEMMRSPCRPEQDGYFGATMGEPVVLQYGYQLESTPHVNVEQAVNLVNDVVMDQLLVKVFPSVCSYFQRRRDLQAATIMSSTDLLVERQRNLGKITGFRFRQHRVNWDHTCTASMNAGNECGIYYTAISVYGYNLHDGITYALFDAITNALQESLSTAAQAGAVRIAVVDALTKTLYGPSTHSKLPTGIMVGLILVALALLVVVMLVFSYVRMHRRAQYARDKLMQPPRPVCSGCRRWWHWRSRGWYNHYQSTVPGHEQFDVTTRTVQSEGSASRVSLFSRGAPGRYPGVVLVRPDPAGAVVGDDILDAFGIMKDDTVCSAAEFANSGSVVDEYSDFQADEDGESHGLL